MKLYDIVHDEENVPKLLSIGEYTLIDPLYDEYTGAEIMIEHFHMGEMENEHLFYIVTNRDLEITGAVMSSIGDQESVNIHERTLLIFLVLTGAKGFAVYHNHPSNNMVASQADISSDEFMQTAADMLEVEYYGSFIIGRSLYLRVGTAEVGKIW